MTKIFVLGGNFKSGWAFLGRRKGHNLQHSEGWGYLDQIIATGTGYICYETLGVYTSLSATY